MRAALLAHSEKMRLRAYQERSWQARNKKADWVQWAKERERELLQAKENAKKSVKQKSEPHILFPRVTEATKFILPRPLSSTQIQFDYELSKRGSTRYGKFRSIHFLGRTA